jgi:hypothetical protein
MDLFFISFNSSATTPVTISPFAGFVYLLACIWLCFFLTKPEKP